MVPPGIMPNSGTFTLWNAIMLAMLNVAYPASMNMMPKASASIHFQRPQ